MVESKGKKNLLTEKKGKIILLASDHSIKELSNKEKTNLLHAFANNGIPLGSKKAFDLVSCKTNIDFSKVEDICKNIKDITVIEMKSTNRKNVDEKFSKYYFSLTLRELYMAQSLKDQHKFILVHTLSKKTKELSWKDLFSRINNMNLAFQITLK